MYKRLTTYHLAIFSALCSLCLFFPNAAFAEVTDQKGISYHIEDIQTKVLKDSLSITISGTTPPAFTTRKLYDPSRLVMDIANVELKDTLRLNNLIPQNNFVDLQTSVLKNQNPTITRLEFQLKGDLQHNVERHNHNLIVHFSATPTNIESVPQSLAVAVQEKEGAPEKSVATDATLEELIDSSEAAAISTNQIQSEASRETLETATSLKDKFQFSGYTKKRISVDFYKIDLHNVFRLFRQISDLNLIVDESVQGTLTLALNDVPWDFALDIILNLTDLEKEERFNTIVIYPKDKAFVWPDRSEDNLSFEADIEIVEQEALIIQRSANQPKEIMLAKEFHRKAIAEEKNENFENAADLYIKAFELWPSNNKLSNKLAALYLVNLGINAKAAFYSQKSLEIKPDDTVAALTAAIAFANMEKLAQAGEYFVQSISESPPRKEALLSYAAFNENNEKPAAALKILDKYHTHYGETVNTMVAKARIYDKLALTEKANAEYKAIFNSGFPIRPDLKRFIENRISEGKL